MKRKWDDENRFLCKVCNLWIANNKAQRDQHESGAKHKAAQANLIKQIAQKNALREKESEARAPRDIKQQHGAGQLLEHALRAVGKPLDANVTATGISSHGFRNDTQSVEPLPQHGDDQTTHSKAHSDANDKADTSATLNINSSPDTVAHMNNNGNVTANADCILIENESDYPLPADQVLGEWVTVEEEEEVAKPTKPIHSLNSSAIGSTEEGDTTDRERDAVKLGQVDETGRPPVSFKRKLPNLSKRKRRRKS